MKQLIEFYLEYKQQVPDSRFWTFDDFINWVMEKYTPAQLEEISKNA